LKKLDEKIFQLNKEIELFDNMENFVEQSSFIFFKEKENIFNNNCERLLTKCKFIFFTYLFLR
jgi:hypothetical protein